MTLNKMGVRRGGDRGHVCNFVRFICNCYFSRIFIYSSMLCPLPLSLVGVAREGSVQGSDGEEGIRGSGYPFCNTLQVYHYLLI